MKKAVWFILLVLVIAGAFRAGTWYNQRTAAVHVAGGEKVLYYVDPMHPAYKSNKPGIAPDCGMALVPVYAEEPAGPLSPPAGTVKVSPEKQQIVGVRISTVERTGGRSALRLFGRVAPDETRVYRINAGVDGSVRQTSSVTTGSRVDRDQWLATFSAPDTRSALQAYLVTLDVLDRTSHETAAQIAQAEASVQLAVDRLQNFGMARSQIEEIRRTRALPVNLRIVAPAAGFVLLRNVSPGQSFEKGTEWYRIADLGRVWILADVSQNDAQRLRPGMRALVSLPHQSRTFPARVSDVLPQFDPASATLKVRFEAENPGYSLRPDMFVDVQVAIPFASAITVPVDAVLDSGLKKTVFVDRGEGFFEPREVETGARFDDRVEIVKGLAPGERIVVAGNFLIGSESRLVTPGAVAPVPVDERRLVASGRQ